MPHSLPCSIVDYLGVRIGVVHEPGHLKDWRRYLVSAECREHRDERPREFRGIVLWIGYAQLREPITEHICGLPSYASFEAKSSMARKRPATCNYAFVMVHNNPHPHRCGMVLLLGLDAAQQEH